MCIYPRVDTYGHMSEYEGECVYVGHHDYVCKSTCRCVCPEYDLFLFLEGKSSSKRLNSKLSKEKKVVGLAYFLPI